MMHTLPGANKLELQILRITFVIFTWTHIERKTKCKKKNENENKWISLVQSRWNKIDEVKNSHFLRISIFICLIFFGFENRPNVFFWRKMNQISLQSLICKKIAFEISHSAQKHIESFCTNGVEHSHWDNECCALVLRPKELLTFIDLRFEWMTICAYVRWYYLEHCIAK